MLEGYNRVTNYAEHVISINNNIKLFVFENINQKTINENKLIIGDIQQERNLCYAILNLCDLCGDNRYCEIHTDNITDSDSKLNNKFNNLIIKCKTTKTIFFDVLFKNLKYFKNFANNLEDVLSNLTNFIKTNNRFDSTKSLHLNVLYDNKLNLPIIRVSSNIDIDTVTKEYFVRNENIGYSLTYWFVRYFDTYLNNTNTLLYYKQISLYFHSLVCYTTKSIYHKHNIDIKKLVIFLPFENMKQILLKNQNNYRITQLTNEYDDEYYEIILDENFLMLWKKIF